MNPLLSWLAELGYQPQQADLFQRALTHRSFSKDNNERLEFLGDALLDLIIGEALYHRFPEKKEGELSRFRAELVKGETLAALARDMGLGTYLRLGAGEKKTGGANRDSILAGSFEALVGALYLDSDHKTCEQWVMTRFESRLQNILTIANRKDAKTSLQEYLQQQKMALPNYTLVKTRGDQHRQTFYISCSISDLNVAVEAQGSSKKLAEQKAAELMLARLSEMTS